MPEPGVLEPRAAPGAELAAAAVARIAEDLGTLVRAPLALESVACERVGARAAGRGSVHVSFRLELRQGRRSAHGCLLVPLPEALELAARLLSAPEESIAERRAAAAPGRAEKEALVELGNFVGGALDQIVHDRLGAGHSARFAGCQGVRPDVRPAFPYAEGEPLDVVRARARLGAGEPFELLALLPVLDGVA